jgi:hypothetical protein
MVLLAAALCSCTAVPRSSSPQIVRDIQVDNQSPAAQRPPNGADPHTIVLDFLQANAANDPNHNLARAYLTPQAKTRWSDATTTILDSEIVSNPGPKGQITVAGAQIGSLNSAGEYKPFLSGSGTGADSAGQTYTYQMTKVHGQWRINPPNGLVVTTSQFEQYPPWVIYFYDASEKHLVPDPRYTSLTDPTAVVEWLVSELAAGPRPELVDGVSTEIPANTDPTSVVVHPGSAGSAGITRIEIPGAGQLNAHHRNLLAAQLASTLVQANQSLRVQITDGGVPVPIPDAGGTSFDVSSLQVQPGGPPNTKLYYVRKGAVLDAAGQPLLGEIGTGGYHLTSVAVSAAVSTGGPAIAGVSGRGARAQLWIGNSLDGLRPTSVKGRLSRPAFAPGMDEIWIGDGKKVFRALPDLQARVVQLRTASGQPASGTVLAVRLSPEGSRVAMVLGTPGPKNDPAERGTLWVGTVVRGAKSVRVENLEPISPPGIDVLDVAWNDQLKLFAIGEGTLLPRDPGIYEVQCDGSLWTAAGLGTLPQQPDSITVTQNADVAVSAGDTVWKQQAPGSWISLHGFNTSGRNPVYVQ